MSGRHSQRGQAIADFALTVSVFLLLLFGILDFGQTLYQYDEIAQAAKLGARWAIVNTKPPGSQCGTSGSTCQTNIINYVKGNTDLNSSNLTVTITFGGTASTCASDPSPGCYVNVQLQYPFSFLGLRLASGTMTSSSQMVIATQHS